MVNGFSKCQSSCFIDLASQREEQTNLAGILQTAEMLPCIQKANREVRWIAPCPFVLHTLPYPVSDRSLTEPFWCISITVRVTIYCWMVPGVLTTSHVFFHLDFSSILLSVKCGGAKCALALHIKRGSFERNLIKSLCNYIHAPVCFIKLTCSSTHSGQRDQGTSAGKQMEMASWCIYMKAAKT